MTTTRTKATGRLRDQARARSSPGVVLPVIKEHLLAKMAHANDDRDQSVIHGSEMAKEDWCIRATYWRIMGKPEPEGKYSFVLENILAEGTSIHEKWQTWLQETGKLWGDWKCTYCGDTQRCTSAELISYCTDHDFPWKYQEISLRDGLITGHADGAIGTNLIELKSVGMGTLRTEAASTLKKYYIPEYKIYDLNALWKDIKHPFITHLRQGNIYLHLAEKMGLPFDSITFVYEFKPFQQVKEFTVKKSDRILEPLLARAGKLTDAVEKKKPPECEFGGCKHCKAYEGDDGQAQESGQQRRGQSPRVHDRKGVHARRGAGPEAGSGRSAAPRVRRAKASARDDGTGRRSDHEPVQPAHRVVRLSGPAAQPGAGGRGARKVRRRAGGSR
jgi:hypothetical protein